MPKDKFRWKKGEVIIKLSSAHIARTPWIMLPVQNSGQNPKIQRQRRTLSKTNTRKMKGRRVMEEKQNQNQPIQVYENSLQSELKFILDIKS